MNLRRDATTVVLDRYASLDVDRHRDAIAESGERLIDGVVDHLENEMVKAPFGGIADVHAGAFTDCFQPLKNPNRFRSVFRSGNSGLFQADYSSKRVLLKWENRLGHSYVNLREKHKTVKLSGEFKTVFYQTGRYEKTDEFLRLRLGDAR
jgi:hypothetical protein